MIEPWLLSEGFWRATRTKNVVCDVLCACAAPSRTKVVAGINWPGGQRALLAATDRRGREDAHGSTARAVTKLWMWFVKRQTHWLVVLAETDERTCAEGRRIAISCQILISCLSEDSIHSTGSSKWASHDWSTYTCKLTRNVLYQAQPWSSVGRAQSGGEANLGWPRSRSPNGTTVTNVVGFSFLFCLLIVRKLMAMGFPLVSVLSRYVSVLVQGRLLSAAARAHHGSADA